MIVNFLAFACCCVSLANAASLRSLRFDSAVAVLPSSALGDTINVRVTQPWFGNCGVDLGDDSDESADRMVIVYPDPDTKEPVCWSGDDVDACFVKSLLVGCNDEGKATVEVYVSDSNLSPRHKQDNPLLPSFQCEQSFGAASVLQTTIIHSETFTCSEPVDTADSVTKCDGQEDCPRSDQYCGVSPEIDFLHCRRYASLDGACGEADQCNPITHHCYTPDACLADPEGPPQGTCRPLGRKCALQLDHCEVNEYCDDIRRCKELQGLGSCCTGSRQCEDGLVCNGGLCAPDNGGGGNQIECIDPALDCPKDGAYFCLSSGPDELAVCRAYQEEGDRCGGNPPPGQDFKCNPASTRCVAPFACHLFDGPGNCVAMGTECSTDAQCGSSDYCDSGRCMPRYPLEGCCADHGCEDGLDCVATPGFLGGELICIDPADPPSPDGDARPEIGEPCGDADICGFGLRCLDGICMPEVDPTPDLTPCTDPAVDCPKDGSYFCGEDYYVDYNICRAYEAIGGTCGGYVPPYLEQRCNPTEAFCIDNDPCGLLHGPGDCVARGGDCSITADCKSDEYCANYVGVCVPRKRESVCCELDEECQGGLECADMPYYSQKGDRYCIDPANPLRSEFEAGGGPGGPSMGPGGP